MNSSSTPERSRAPTPTIVAHAISDEDVRAWATVGKEIVDAVGAGWMHPTAPPPNSDPTFPLDTLYPVFYGGADGLAALDILCPLGQDTLAASLASAREFARGCDLARAIINNNGSQYESDPEGRAHKLFQQVDDALVLAGASDQPTRDSARRSVLLPLLSRIFEPYRYGTPGDLDASKTLHSLHYVCPSMLSDGAASKEACAAVAVSISPGTTTQPGSLQQMIASILAALAQP